MLWILADGVELVGLYGSFIGAKGVVKVGCEIGGAGAGEITGHVGSLVVPKLLVDVKFNVYVELGYNVFIVC
jgi:UDP-3-O-[3-hydroxymyristoyl] glucosamine N-acyltransferase